MQSGCPGFESQTSRCSCVTWDDFLLFAEFLWPCMKGLHVILCLKYIVHSRYSKNMVLSRVLNAVLTFLTTFTPKIPAPSLHPIIFRMLIHYQIHPVICTLALRCLTPATQLPLLCPSPHLLFQKDGQGSGGACQSKGNLSLAQP